jgi:hypothetical protein
MANIYCVPNIIQVTVLGPGDIVVNKTKIFIYMEISFYQQELDKIKINAYFV